MKKSISGFFDRIFISEKTRRKRKREDDLRRRKHQTYERILAYMETKEAFLNPNLQIQDVASAVYTNKSYVSTVVNEFSRMNFKQFLNSYRIAYAVRLMEKKPGLTAKRIGELSGFNNEVTFNVAFRARMGTTPGCCLQNFRCKLPSSSEEQVQ